MSSLNRCFYRETARYLWQDLEFGFGQEKRWQAASSILLGHIHSFSHHHHHHRLQHQPCLESCNGTTTKLQLEVGNPNVNEKSLSAHEGISLEHYVKSISLHNLRITRLELSILAHLTGLRALTLISTPVLLAEDLLDLFHAWTRNSVINAVDLDSGGCMLKQVTMVSSKGMEVCQPEVVQALLRMCRGGGGLEKLDLTGDDERFRFLDEGYSSSSSLADGADTDSESESIGSEDEDGGVSWIVSQSPIEDPLPIRTTRRHTHRSQSNASSSSSLHQPLLIPDLIAQYCPNLTHLSLAHIDITLSSIESMCHACPHLQSVSLTHLRGWDDAMAHALFRLPHIQTLRLTQLSMTDRGFTFDSDSVPNGTAIPTSTTSLACPSLHMLELTNTRVTDTGISRLIRHLPHLRHLDLSYSRLISSSVLDSVKRWRSIECVNLFGCVAVDSEDVKRFLERYQQERGEVVPFRIIGAGFVFGLDL